MQYKKENSYIDCAMIYFSNTFDEINHDVMMDKLLKSSLPNTIVRIIEYMLKYSFADVLFYDGKGDEWKINKGSRQEGILLPLLLNFV